MTRIFIEGYELDVNQGFSNQLNFSIDDLSKLDTKTTSFSKTIILPGTANNNKLLGNIFEFSNSNFTINEGKNVLYNFNASKSAQARIEVDGLQVMKGVLRLIEIVIDGSFIEYEVALFGELGGFFSSLGAKTLEDLDFSAYNHTYNVTNIVNSWDSSGGTGYYYPLIDYGQCSPLGNANFNKKNFYYTAFRPALYVREYIDKIITGAGYTWQSSFFNTNFFKRLIVPNNENGLLKRGITNYITAAITTPKTISGSDPLGNNQNAVWDSYTINNFTINTPHNLFTYSGAQTISVRVSGTITGTTYFSGIGYGSLSIKIYDTGTGNAYYIGGVPFIKANTSTPFSVSFNSVFQISTSSQISLNVRIIGNNHIGYYGTTTINSATLAVDSDPPTYINYQLNDTLEINRLLPKNVFQKDFFASILKMFYLLVTEDKIKEKHLIIEPYVDFYNTNRTTYIDWSNKVDRSQAIRIKPMSEINARYYTLKYKDDVDYFNEQYRKKWFEGYGNIVYDNQQEFAKDSDSAEVIFSNSVLVGYNGEDKVFPAIYKLNNSLEETISHNIRIMQRKKVTGVSAWYIKDSNGNNLGSSLTSYGYAGHYDDPDAPNSDLCFGSPKELQFELLTGALGNNLFNTYYSPYFAEITDKDSRLVKCRMKFTIKDIYNLDFTKFIWIDGVLYRLYKIIDFVDNDTCNVELLRVIYTTY